MTFDVEHAFAFIVPGALDIAGISLSVVANTYLGMAWFGKIFGRTWVQSICHDKGITGKGREISMEEFSEAQKTRWPYPTSYCFASSLGCNIIKSWFLWHWMTALGIDALLDAILLALCWSTVHLVSIHQYFWQGRTITLMALDYGFEVFTFVVTAVVVSSFPMAFG